MPNVCLLPCLSLSSALQHSGAEVGLEPVNFGALVFMDRFRVESKRECDANPLHHAGTQETFCNIFLVTSTNLAEATTKRRAKVD